MYIKDLVRKTMHIIHARSSEEIDTVRKLFREYESFLGVDLDFQDFESELESLPGKYAPPDGALLLAMEGKHVVGCGALRRFGLIKNNTCEMKRLFVLPAFRGLGKGRQLALRLVEEAVRLGYSTMLLDTLERLTAAIALYKSIGFVRTKPYYENPLPGVVYWKLDLRRGC